MLYKNYIKFIIGFIFIFFFGCNNTETIPQQVDNPKAVKITSKDLEKQRYVDYAFSRLSEKAIEDWPSFKELIAQIDLLKKGNLSFFQSESKTLKTFFFTLKEETPQSINKASLIVRLTVLETKAFQLKEITQIFTTNKDQQLLAIKEVLIAYSHVVLQINKMLEQESQAIVKPT